MPSTDGAPPPAHCTGTAGRIAAGDRVHGTLPMSRPSTAIARVVAFSLVPTAPATEDEMPWIPVAKDKKGFALDPPGRPFVPWGLNYDHDDKGRLIEDYWEEEWPAVEAHFGQMKKLGANVV